MIRALQLTATLGVAGWAAAAWADDLTPERMAKIQLEEAEARTQVDKAHENRKVSEMDSDERRQYASEQQEAHRQVLEKNDVEEKEYVLYKSRMEREERQQQKEELQKLKDQQEARKADEEQPPGEPVIERGKPASDASNGRPQHGNEKKDSRNHASSRDRSHRNNKKSDDPNP